MSAHGDHRVRNEDVWDDQEAGRKIRIKFRRGPAKITWPLAPKKALIELTGRKTLRRAFVAFVHFFNERRAQWRKRPFSAEKIQEEWMSKPWTEDDFVKSAKEWLRYPRKGFNAASQKKRILKVFRKLGISTGKVDS
jgi:hypothetical protein